MAQTPQGRNVSSRAAWAALKRNIVVHIAAVVLVNILILPYQTEPILAASVSQCELISPRNAKSILKNSVAVQPEKGFTVFKIPRSGNSERIYQNRPEFFGQFLPPDYRFSDDLRAGLSIQQKVGGENELRRDLLYSGVRFSEIFEGITDTRTLQFVLRVRIVELAIMPNDIANVIANDGYEQMGSLGAYESVSRSLGGIGGLPSDGNGILHVTGLLGRSVLRASYEPDRRAPEHQRYNGKQPLTGLHSQNGDFRTVLASAFCLLWATWIYLRGWTVVGWLCAAYAIFGLMLRIDLWSLAIWLL
jgi:hypothetical protein